ncbi:hypothetical protein D3C74_299200 [compost metagenome]
MHRSSGDAAGGDSGLQLLAVGSVGLGGGAFGAIGPGRGFGERGRLAIDVESGLVLGYRPGALWGVLAQVPCVLRSIAAGSIVSIRCGGVVGALRRASIGSRGFRLPGLDHAALVVEPGFSDDIIRSFSHDLGDLGR